MSNRFDELAQSTMSEHDLDVLGCVLPNMA